MEFQSKASVNDVYRFGDHVHLIDEAFFIPQLNRSRPIWIYLPKGYAKSDKRYPVIYMHDGQNLFHAQPPRTDEWAVDTVLDELIRSGSKEMIVVGIHHGEDQRLTEYNPYNSEHGLGEGKLYISFLIDTLKPFIDQNYRTLTDVENTVIAGSSMGGLISMYAIVAHPDVFGAAGIFSAAFWLAPEIFELIDKEKDKLFERKIFFVIGDKEGEVMLSNTKKAYQILNPDGKNENIIFIEKGDGKHTEWFWHREFIPFYEFISR